MILVSGLYTDFVVDLANKDQNGAVSYKRFNRWLWIVQLRLFSWLTGSLDEPNSPEKVSPQKARDWCSKFIKKYPVVVSRGTINKPDDYYLFRDLYKLKGVPVECVDDYNEDELRIIKQPIELLDNSKFTTRTSTSIRRLKPENKSIAKLTGDGFEFAPDDLGSVVLEYYRLPLKAEIKTKKDDIYNKEVPDESTSINLEWSESVRSLLLHFLGEQFSLNVRESQFQQQNAVVK